MYGDYSGSNGGDKCNHSDHYDSKKDAEAAARRKGMSGAHKMSCRGKTVWMPGSDHGDYMDSREGPDIPGL
jgi:hypothetical protein